MQRSTPEGGRGQGSGGGFGLGPDGVCMCTNPKCGFTVPHQRAVPCYQVKCPQCGGPMTRAS